VNSNLNMLLHPVPQKFNTFAIFAIFAIFATFHNDHLAIKAVFPAKCHPERNDTKRVSF